MDKTETKVVINRRAAALRSRFIIITCRATKLYLDEVIDGFVNKYPGKFMLSILIVWIDVLYASRRDS